MQKNFVTVLIALLFIPVFLYAQERTILRPIKTTIFHKGSFQKGEVIPVPQTREQKIQYYKNRLAQNRNVKNLRTISDNPANLTDTLYTEDDPVGQFGSNFGFFGQDRMVQWFKAPADLTLKEVGFSFYSAYVPVADVEMKIVAFQPGITENDLEYLTPARQGFYEALGNGNHDATAFLDDPDRTGPWTSIDGHPEIFEHDIWSDAGSGYVFTPQTDSVNHDVYQFVPLNILFEPDIPGGTLFAVVLKNTTGLNQSRVGLNGTAVGGTGVNRYSLQKYYADGRLTPPTDYGWWQRDETLYYAAVVDIYGDTPPDINSYTMLPGGTDLGPFTVDANITDANPGGGTAGVASAKVLWSIDDWATTNEVTMTGSEPNFSGDIPMQPGNTKVSYRIEATDVNDNTSQSAPVFFYTFEPTGATTLVIFNGFPTVDGFPQDDYFGPNVEFDHDTWVSNGGGITDESILENYDNIFEIWNEANGTYNDSLEAIWLAGNSNRNLYLAGQEWLGARYSYTDMDFTTGDFEFDVLGINHSYNDISYDGSVGQNIPTLVMPQAGTMFGQPLVDLFNSLTPPADSMMVNPTFITGNNNWQDAYDVESDVEVDMMVETRGIGGAAAVDTLPTMSHRTLTAGNKIVYAAYDPIVLTTAVDDSYPYFYWVGGDTSNSVYQALKWFDVPTGVSETGAPLPTEYSLSQNYPNPFNPATKIDFSIPQSSKVTLKVYDILGNEVATLVNETRTAGNYEVNFNASNLASGMYIYTITAGNYTASKKLMLLK